MSKNKKIIFGLVLILLLASGFYLWKGSGRSGTKTPEEAYAKFHQALLDKNYDAALGLIAAKNRDSYRDAFSDKEKLDHWAAGLPDKITKEGEDTYDLGNGGRMKFVQDASGGWEIETF